MSLKNNLNKLIAKHQFRLQKLKEQQALKGLSVDPDVLYEIEKIEGELDRLNLELDNLPDEPSPINAEASMSQLSSPLTPELTGTKTTAHQPTFLRSASWHILIVDDDPSWQKRLKRTLRGDNHVIITANSYDEAEIELTNPNLDLVTIDLHLDQDEDYADGLDLIHHIRQEFGSHFPIIIVTGQGDLERQRRAFVMYNVIDFIEKAKFEPKAFKDTVTKAILDK